MEAIVLAALVVMAGAVLAYGWYLSTKEITDSELESVRF